MLGRYVSCSSKQVGAVVKSIQTLHFPLDWKKVQVNNKLHVYINMDRQSLTKQIMDFILPKNQKFIFVHGKILVVGKKKQGFLFWAAIQIFLIVVHRLERSWVLWLELEVRYFSTIDIAWLVMSYYRVLYQKEERIGYSHLVFLRLKVNGSQSIHSSTVCWHDSLPQR